MSARAHATRAGADPLLVVEDLSVTFTRPGQESFTAVDGVGFEVRPGEVVGLVGESGCGKSVTSLAIMGLLPRRGTRVGGRAIFDGVDLLSLSDRELRDRRGADVAMIFQDPLSSLNPVVPLGVQVAEVIQRHRRTSRSQATRRAQEMLARVGIPDPARRMHEYPHQISGGMRQRVLIAIALACEPRLLIADEPTTALDVTIQAQILALLKELVVGSGTSLIMITHDLGVVAGLCDTVNVLYGGRIVERADRYSLFDAPRHPYTGGLLESVPALGDEAARLRPIPGSVADNIPWSEGCAFAPRCRVATDLCFQEGPTWSAGGERRWRCHHPLPDPIIVAKEPTP
ncbi:ABC transporter ATP-binding protein [Spongiactinospora sp. TRM90649]|uniref:ABC transporter ATP-binding protein n=1 Tax=Spongiactinospora sp. TRM90649 TaxID=3031114 RepID=UPI0023F87E82|nr:ABC transporter ATP-binding protein [Spongiactinospora sp. TRM90649]MDF5756361.1 ABC transporter ATP-binding protein [Spongiactinospora sp. TRM90649]